jgi:hypothetical protein
VPISLQPDDLARASLAAPTAVDSGASRWRSRAAAVLDEADVAADARCGSRAVVLAGGRSADHALQARATAPSVIAVAASFARKRVLSFVIALRELLRTVLSDIYSPSAILAPPSPGEQPEWAVAVLACAEGSVTLTYGGVMTEGGGAPAPVGVRTSPQASS